MKTYIVTCTYQDFYRPPDFMIVDADDVEHAIEQAENAYPDAVSFDCMRMKSAEQHESLWTSIVRWFA